MTTPELLARIQSVHATTTGWCPLQKAFDLATTVLALRPKVVIELGVWGGRSLVPMALAVQAIGDGTVYAVDPWAASASVEGYDKANADWWGVQDHQKVYLGFVELIRAHQLESVVSIQRMKSSEFRLPKQQIDVAHIDGQHCAQAIADVERYAPRVRVGGVVVLDDINWTTGGVPHVQLAVARLLKLGFVELYRTKVEGEGEWAFFQRVKPARR